MLWIKLAAMKDHSVQIKNIKNYQPSQGQVLMTSRRRPTSRKPMFELAGKVSPSTGQNHQRFQIIPARLSKLASVPPDAKTWTIFTAPPLVTIRLKKMRGAPGIVRVRAIISLNNFNTSDTSESTRAASTARYSTWGPKILSWWRISCRLSSDFEQIRSKIRCFFADKEKVVLLLVLGPIMNVLRTVMGVHGSILSTLHRLLFSASNANPQKPEVSNLLAGVSGADLMCKDIAVFATR